MKQEADEDWQYAQCAKALRVGKPPHIRTEANVVRLSQKSKRWGHVVGLTLASTKSTLSQFQQKGLELRSLLSSDTAEESDP